MTDNRYLKTNTYFFNLNQIHDMKKLLLISLLLWSSFGQSAEMSLNRNGSVPNDVLLSVEINNSVYSNYSFERKINEPIGVQQTNITGTVTDPNGAPLPSVTITEKGTNNGTLTDFDGNFSIEVQSSSSVLVFSYVGLKSIERAVGANTTMDIVMEEDAQSLDVVVVTALGIKRSEKSLTYANQQVKGDDLTKARTTNFASNLSGRVAGLEVRSSSSGAGGSTKMVLRGNKSLSGDSQPLYVIDGIPLANNKGGQPVPFGGTDEGDGLSQINQDDIESITVLKGANAAVLYGSEGANGVVIITTKSGKKGAAQVTVNSGVTFSSVTGVPDLQFRYGSEGGTKESWSDMTGDYEDGYVDDFFDTGVNFINSASVSGGNDITTAYFSFSNVSANGVIPTNKYLRNNATFKQTTKLFDDKLTISSNTLLTYEKTQNRPSAGYYLNPLTGLYFFPRDKNFEQYKDYQYFDEDRNMYLQNWFVDDHLQSNPYWISNKEPREDHTRRVITSLNLSYDITKELNFQVRGNYDYAKKSYERRHSAGSNITNVNRNGRWEYKDFTDELMYTDALLTYDTKFEDFTLMAVAGASYKKTVFGDGVSVDNGTDGLLYPNIFEFQNLASNVQVQSTIGSRAIKQGAFLTANLGYKDLLFLDLAGRQDWASTLAGTGNESYFYPSVGLTGIISEMVEMPDFITFGKVRASYSVVANEVPYNRVDPQNTITSGGGIALNTTKPFSNLEPEMISSLELGLNWKFFNNRLGFDFTYYYLDSKDQFIALPAPSGSQYTTYYVNAGEIQNKGVEVALYAKPVKSEYFNWNTTFNFSTNKNKVIELDPNLKQPISLGDSEGYQSKIVPGGSIGDLYVFKFQRDEEGRIVLEDGKPLRTKTTEYVGNANPDWSLGWNNEFNFRNYSLSVLFSGKFGGKVISQTESLLDGYGVSERSAIARDNGGVSINGVENGASVTKVNSEDWYTTVGGRNGIKEAYVYDRTNIRLGQLSLSYNFNLSEDAFARNFSVSLVGQNLFFIYKDAPYDPELTLSTGSNYLSLDNFNAPSTATYGLNFKIGL